MFWFNALVLAGAVAAAWVLLYLSIDEEAQANPRRLGGSLERRLAAARRRFSRSGGGPATGWFVLMHVMAVALGAAALWWFLFPDQPGEALADSLKAAGAAVYAELWLARLRS